MTSIRQLSPRDISEVLRVQKACYVPALVESAQSFENKLALWKEGCLGAWVADTLGGYLFAHPWRFGEIVPLDDDSYAIPSDADCMYLHDTAVDPAFRHLRVPHDLITAIATRALAAKLNRFALVAVQNSEPYWSRWGFHARRTFEYAPSVAATYMVLEGEPSWK